MTRSLSRQLAGLLAYSLGVLLLTSTSAAAAPGDHDVSGWPLPGTPQVVGAYNPPAASWQAGHRGVDLAAQVGDPVLAAAGGVIAFAGTVAGTPVVSIDHPDGRRTTYQPVSAQVRVGQQVSTGGSIGTLAAGSHCAQACLHWGLKQGKTYLNPLILVGATGGALRLLPAGHHVRVAAEARARAMAAAATRAAKGSGGGAGASGPPPPPGSQGLIRPVPGVVTSAYGMRFHPVLKRWKLHDGTDFGASCGTPIRAASGGRVSAAYFNPGYGNRLLIDHGSVKGRSLTTAYNHATGFVVSRGNRVSRGEVIGYVGSTGYSTGCHLHLMVWIDGRLSNPMTVL